MNAYIIVEGAQTEMHVYPAWLEILVPHMSRIEEVSNVSTDNYYLFSGGGIPSIYQHISHAVMDINAINAINAQGSGHYDFLMVCIDTEQENRQYIMQRIQDKLKEDNVVPNGFRILVFEQKVCMESWFLGNRRVFKSNPQNAEYLSYIRFYNVSHDNPELMENGDKERFNTKAQFHGQYLRDMLRERNMHYSKNHPEAVCSQIYLNELISRYKQTGHIRTFGSWYDFVINNL